jgi:hypothetical protein
VPVLDKEALTDVVDYAKLRVLRKLRNESRQATEKEEILLQFYDDIL